MSYQVYETVIREEVQHALSPRASHLFDIHVQVPKYNGALEALQGLLKVRPVFQHQRWQVRSGKRGGLSESGEYIAYYHVRPTVTGGINTPPERILPRHHPDTALIPPGAGWTHRQKSHVVAKTIM